VRILVVSNLYPPAAEGGYEMICADTVNALAGQHQFMVLTSAPRADKEGLASGEDVGPPTAVVRRQLPFFEHRRADSFRAPAWAIAGARSMRQAIHDHRPELIFFFNATEIPHSVLWVARQSGVPIAFYIAAPFLSGLYREDRFARHLTGDDRGIRGGWAMLMKLVNLSPQLCIRPRASMRASVAWVSEATRAQSPPPDFMQVRVARVINPATRRYARFAAVRRPLAGRTPLIAYVGRLEWQKGPDLAIRAFARLVGELGIPAEMEIAGPGEPRYVERLKQQATELGVADRVAFRGPLALDDVVALFERASVLVVPSVWQEPMATTPLEAAFARLPVVAADSGGMPEALRPDIEALYFPIGDWETCASRLAEVLRDGEGTAKRVSRARARAREFSFEQFLRKLEEFLAAAVEPEPG
jgi:glycosyltransferase involved in cell wall biosynthesis